MPPPTASTPGVAAMPTQTAAALGLRQRFKQLTPRMAFMIVCLSAAAFNFGYDQGGFSGIQAMDGTFAALFALQAVTLCCTKR